MWTRLKSSNKMCYQDTVQACQIWAQTRSDWLQMGHSDFFNTRSSSQNQNVLKTDHKTSPVCSKLWRSCKIIWGQICDPCCVTLKCAAMCQTLSNGWRYLSYLYTRFLPPKISQVCPCCQSQHHECPIWHPNWVRFAPNGTNLGLFKIIWGQSDPILMPNLKLLHLTCISDSSLIEPS